MRNLFRIIFFLVVYLFFVKVHAQHNSKKISGFYLVVKRSSLKLYDSASKKNIYLNPEKICGISDFKEAKYLIDKDLGQPFIELDLNKKGAQKFYEATKTNIGKSMAIIIDNKILLNPTINSAIAGGRLTIAGNYSIAEAHDLANSINRKIENNKSKF